MVSRALDPFCTTKEGKRVGLGLGLLAQAAEATGGSLSIDSSPGNGTAITAEFITNHPDMKPIGDLAETIGTIVVGNPEVRFIFDVTLEGDHSHFDSMEIP